MLGQNGNGEGGALNLMGFIVNIKDGEGKYKIGLRYVGKK